MGYTLRSTTRYDEMSNTHCEFLSNVFDSISFSCLWISSCSSIIYCNGHFLPYLVVWFLSTIKSSVYNMWVLSMTLCACVCVHVYTNTYTHICIYIYIIFIMIHCTCSLRKFTWTKGKKPWKSAWVILWLDTMFVICRDGHL